MNTSAGIRHAVAALRRRQRLRILLDGALFIAALVSLTLLLARTFDLESRIGLPVVPLALGAGIAVFLIHAAIALAVTRALGTTARRTEQKFGLQERLSTALEVSEGASEPVREALLSDTSVRAARLDRRAAAPLAGPSTALAAGLLVLFSAGLLVTAPAPRPAPLPATAEAEAPAEPDAEPTDTLLEDIARMADLLARDAETREESYLEAVSNALRELAEEAPGLDREEALERFMALAEHAALGYGDTPPEWMEPGQSNMGEIGQRMAAFEAAETARAAAAEARQAQAMMDDEYGAPILSSDALADIIRQGLLEPAQLDPAMADAAGQAQGMAETLPDGAPMSGGSSQPEPMEEQLMRPGSAMPMGAAMESGRGDSRIAGGGSQDLAESSEYMRAEFAESEEIVISAAETEPGSRIRIQIAPETSASAVADDAGPSRDWRRQADTAVTRHAVTPDARPVIARYFARSATPPTTGR
ncbi:hypothetical protein EMQ25_09220 [Arsenicitalea aurantiaca]|uniref:Uncharacterized protein n=2 Tax=Arsenicitalea aurantiaca TaxID=1783274 RepID=A0A433XAJ3_9HYPH|nr:hypothetical protein EMQ25_09220 [Arsenicitalea aurantiaca]